jgi:sugar lactone lactonase YvrE
MTAIYYDTEFLEDGRTIDLISIGMVCEDGRELYAVNRDMPLRKIRKHKWLMANVVPHLPQPHGDRRNRMPTSWLFDYADSLVKHREQIADEVRRFIQATPDPQLWAWYGAYDHVALAQLWGPMINLPTGVPMWTNDLRQEAERLGNPRLPEQQDGEHNALADARHNRVIARALAAHAAKVAHDGRPHAHGVTSNEHTRTPRRVTMGNCPPHIPHPHTEVFATVPFPGHPLGIVADGDTLYVGTHRTATGEPGVPSHVYAYNRHGEITQDWTIEGQTETGQGITGIALDHDGVLYIVDQAPSRVITLDPRTGKQRLYAELPDVPLCEGEPDGACSAAATDRPAQPINLCFDAEGNLYVGDLTQAAIWKIPNGGGSAEVWYTASDLDSLFGPNSVAFLDHGRTLLFADSAHGLLDPANLPTAKGRLYTLAINPDGTPGERKLFWEGTRDGDTPDGFTIGASGNVYVALAVGNQLLALNPQGEEIVRVPDARHADKLDVPYNLPGGVTFWGKRLMVTNQVFLGGPASSQVIFSLNVHEQGKAPYRPRVTQPPSAT